MAKSLKNHIGVQGRLTDNEIYFDRLKDIPESPGVYLLTDSVTGRKYVGSAINLYNRVFCYMKPHSPEYLKILFFALTPDRIEISILQEFESISKEELLQAELNWINKLKTFFPKGLNHKNPVTNKTYLKPGQEFAMKFIRDSTGFHYTETRRRLRKEYLIKKEQTRGNRKAA